MQCSKTYITASKQARSSRHSNASRRGRRRPPWRTSAGPVRARSGPAPPYFLRAKTIAARLGAASANQYILIHNSNNLK